ncbi:AraC family transcriptional regulator [Gracilibacillus sp. S3-1-1]|uniref:AraC family transcriptional regulator n=1 Tax=Gracilibacillus pellucidus TaxID=3095368 RepID=A0ACC6M4H9_9BACI|nr:AraC family transcriptional regulator [Gracilibacillus sp. S3-1-1]MDX8045737.1 AraC family transcriptional regulator [Gracilibacillus sp. S3-1-1]
MSGLRELNQALDYIEEHLTDEMDYAKVASIACCSEYHFKRMFSFLAGIALSEYIRRRRLTVAAFELQNSNTRVIDIAIKCGYQSPDSFARAFRDLHGINPSEVKLNGSLLKSFPKMTFQLSIEGGNEMNYRIEERDSFRIVGVQKRVPIIFEGENPEITAMWKSLNKEKIAQLKEFVNTEPAGIIQASTNFSEGRMEEEGELDHYIGVATTKESPEQWSSLEVPAYTWAVFESIGPFPQHLQETWGRIYSEWFPSSHYQQTKGPEILWNENSDFNSSTFKCEIWIPVEKK